MLTRRPSVRGAVSIALAAILAFGLGFFPHRAAGLGREGADSTLVATRRTESEIDELVSSLIASGNYVEGEAIVCYLDSRGLSAQSDSETSGLLAGAETLSTVTALQYAEATGETISVDVEQGVLTVQSSDEPVEILKVCDYTQSTEQLLRELLHNPQVLSAEPNYVMRFEEDEQSISVDGVDPVISSDDLDEQPEGIENETPDGQPDTIDEAIDIETAVDISTNAEAEIMDSLTVEAEDITPSAASDAVGPASPDLTDYQWFSTGAALATPQYLDEANPGVSAPNWNDAGTTNASGVVAILDSGVDYTHPDLAGVMYHFTPEQQAELGCGEFGYAPAREDTTDPMDGYEHGTHCAGIVAAEWNDYGVSGIASGVQLVAVSVSQSLENSDFSYDSIIKGYDFLIRAAEAGVDIRVVNRSLGSAPVNNADNVMIQAAGEAGIVTCIASGNEHLDLEAKYTDTSTIQSNPYIVRVNASNPQDRRAPFSNYGRYITDLFAPGTSILSTLPSNQEASSRYFLEADNDPVYVKTDFNNMLVDLFSTDEDGVQVHDVSQGYIGYDGDGSSAKASISTVTGAYAKVYVDVPVGDLSCNDVQDIGLTFSIGENEARYPGLSILLDDETYTNENNEGVMELCDSGPNGWVFCRLHLTDTSALPSDFAHVIDSQGNTCIRLAISFRPNITSYEPDAALDTDMYIDQIVIGGPGNSGFLPYGYMTGTSMATPCVTGCAAIVSATVDAADPAARAAETVRILKGAVRQAEGYRGYCKQNGQVDLRLLGYKEEYVPTIESAQVLGDTLVVEGAYFTSGGTLFVGDTEAEVLSWSDGKIEAAWPRGLASGLIPLTVRTDEGAEVCRAFILEAPEGISGTAPLYERDLTPVNLRPDGKSSTSIPYALVATEDGVLYAAPTASDDRLDETTRHIMRSDDQGVSWTSIELPDELKHVSLAAGDGKVFILGGTPSDTGYGEDYWELFSLDVSNGTFEQLARHDAINGRDDTFRSAEGTLAYVNGQLYYVDFYTDLDDYSAPAHMRIRRFNAEKSILEGAVLLDHDYGSTYFLWSPKVAVAGNSIYVSNMTDGGESERPVEEIVGLERVDVASDGSLSCTDLSAALYPLGGTVAEKDFSIAASKEGVFLIGTGLDALLPSGADRTDTFLLRDGASTFEPYDKTLSYAPFNSPVSVCADGWLYAYGISNYEDTAVFGRATKIAADEKPEPDKPDDPDKDDTPSKPDSGKTLPKTGDSAMGLAVAALASFGAAAIAVGVGERKRDERP